MIDQRLQALRERIRAVCLHDQAQWDTTCRELLHDSSHGRRGFVSPKTLFDMLKLNKVVVSRSDARLLLEHFQEPHGAVVVAKVLHWIALTPPADYVNPDLVFPRLIQPHRCIQKVLDHDIFNAAWKIITTESARYQSDNLLMESSLLSSKSGIDQSSYQPNSDYETAKRRLCKPTRQLPLARDERIVGLASHSLLSIVIAAVNHERMEDKIPPSLRVISTIAKDVSVLAEFPIEFHTETSAPTCSADTTVTSCVLINKMSALQLANDRSCCLAVHVTKITTIERSGEQDANSAIDNVTQTTHDCVNIYAITIDTTQAPCGNDNDLSCQLIAQIIFAQTLNSTVVDMVLSSDSQVLAVTFADSSTLALYSLQCYGRALEPADPTLVLSSPAFQIELEPLCSTFIKDECKPMLHFLVTPSTSRDQSARTTYAIAVCYGSKILKYLLPLQTDSDTSRLSPFLLTPTKSWDHLTNITASTHDITTQYVVIGCQDGSVVVWDVLQDVDFATLTPALRRIEQVSSKSSGRSSSFAISSIFYQAGYVVALCRSQQHLYFFDVRKRGNASLMRVVSLPLRPRPSMDQEAPSHLTDSMMKLTAAADDCPMVLVESANRMVLFYDIRTAQALGCVAPLFPVHCPGAMNIVGNDEALAVIGNSTLLVEPSIDLYSWRDILLTCFSTFYQELEQRQQESTCAAVKALFLSSDVAAPAAQFTTLTASSVPADPLATIFLHLAGDVPSWLPQSAKKVTTGASEASKGQELLSFDFDAFTSSVVDTSIMSELRVSDDLTFFERYCSQHLDPQAIAETEVKLHCKRQELLRILSTKGAW